MKNKLPYTLTKEQLLKVLSVVQDMRLVIVIFLGTFLGLRISEIVRLKWSDVDLVYGEARIMDAKNPNRHKTGYGQDRIVPINEMFLPVLKKWMMMNQGEPFVIPRKDHGNKKKDHTIRVYQDQFQKCLQQVGLDEVDYYQRDERPRYKFHLHTLRHVCGTNLYRAGLDLYQIKEFLGHKDIKTTQIYCEIGKDDLKEAAHVALTQPKTTMSRRVKNFEPIVEVVQDLEALKLQNENLKMMLKLKEAPYVIQQKV